MESDFSWKRSAGEYLHIYSNITGQPWPPHLGRSRGVRTRACCGGGACEEPAPRAGEGRGSGTCRRACSRRSAHSGEERRKALRVDTTGRALVAKEEKPTALTQIPADQPKALVKQEAPAVPAKAEVPAEKAPVKEESPAKTEALRRRRLRRRRSSPGSPRPKTADARRQRSPQRPNLHQPRRPKHRLQRKRRPRRMGPQLLMRRSKRSKEGS